MSINILILLQIDCIIALKWSFVFIFPPERQRPFQIRSDKMNQKEYQKKYMATDKGKESKKRAMKKYLQTDKYRAVIKKYQDSDKYRENIKRRALERLRY